MLNRFKGIYENRWENSKNTVDSDLLSENNLFTQAGFFYQEYNKVFEELIKLHFKETKNLKLLEIGAGRGTSSIYLSKNLSLNPTLTDYSENAREIGINNLKKYDVNAQYLVADLFDLPFDPESFEIVLSVGVMEHIENLEKGFAEMYKLLRNGGLLISLNVPEKVKSIQSKFNLLNKIFSKLYREHRKIWLDKKSQSKTADVYRSKMTAEEFCNVVESIGFKNTYVIELNPFPTIAPLSQRSEKKLVKLYIFILKIRHFFNKSKNPFVTANKYSRAHVVIGIR